MPFVLFAMALRHLVLLHPILLLHFRLLRLFLVLLWAVLGIPAVRALHKNPCVTFPAATRMPPPRCCTPISDEFKPSYASVLVYGQDAAVKLEDAVRAAESRQRITSCFTAWCRDCQRTYLLTTDLAAFPSPSAHHTHQLLLLSTLRESGAFFPSEPV